MLSTHRTIGCGAFFFIGGARIFGYLKYMLNIVQLNLLCCCMINEHQLNAITENIFYYVLGGVLWVEFLMIFQFTTQRHYVYRGICNRIVSLRFGKNRLCRFSMFHRTIIIPLRSTNRFIGCYYQSGMCTLHHRQMAEIQTGVMMMMTKGIKKIKHGVKHMRLMIWFKCDECERFILLNWSFLSWYATGEFNWNE